MKEAAKTRRSNEPSKHVRVALQVSQGMAKSYISIAYHIHIKIFKTTLIPKNNRKWYKDIFE